MKTLLYNAKVWLGKSKFAVSVGFDSITGKILYSGKYDGKFKIKYDEVIDLKGKLVLPAFSDGHCHLIAGAMVNSQINFRNVSTKNEMQEEIGSYRIKMKSGEVIFGGYFSEANFKENIRMERYFLDSLCWDLPMVIFRNDLHSCILNSKAIEGLGIENSLKKFHPNEAPRDYIGNLTGEFKENAFTFVRNTIPQKTIKEKSDILKSEIEKLHKFGVTSISDITFIEDLEVYEYLLKKNELNLKIDSRIPVEDFDKIENIKLRFIDYAEYIKFISLKAFYDGSLSSHTAYFQKNYRGTKFNGFRTDAVNNGTFRDNVFKIDKAGYQLSVHAIGDKAVSELLDILSDIESKNGKRDRRFRIEHAQHINASDILRFKKLNAIVSVQPSHLNFDAKIASDIIEDLESTHRFKPLIDADTKVCFGTDFPVVTENPFDTIYYAMTRKVEGFPSGFYTENNLDLETCLSALTSANAFASFDEQKRGSIEIGKDADIIVLENDLFSMKPEEIKNGKVEMTFLNGKRVF
ncbi:MAG TPA: amidohydrolase [Ignavibacteria bacterium]